MDLRKELKAWLEPFRTRFGPRNVTFGEVTLLAIVACVCALLLVVRLSYLLAG